MHPSHLLDNWLRVVATRNPDAVTNLYAYEGILIGTVAKRIKQGHKEIREYFQGFLAKDGLRGRTDSMLVQHLGPYVILSGTYTFQWREGWRTKRVKARYSFVFALMDRGWVIVNHHSSAIPE